MTLLGCALPDASGVAIRLAVYGDCTARLLGQDGFQALVSSWFRPVLTGLLTICIAMVGYRLLLGEQPGARSGIGLFARIGLVAALTMGWPAYQILVYDVATWAPGEIANTIMPAAGLGDPRSFPLQVQGAYDAIHLAALSPDPVVQAATPIRAASGSANAASKASNPWQIILAATGAIFVASTIGATVAVRLLVGLLLAIGPLFVSALLFDGTRGLFEGWIRALGGAALGSLGAAIVVAVELAVIPAVLPGVRFAGADDANDPMALLAVVILFTVVMVVMLAGTTRVASGFRLPASWRGRVTEASQGRASIVAETTPWHPGDAGPRMIASPVNARATRTADAIAAVDRRREAASRIDDAYGTARHGSARATGSIDTVSRLSKPNSSYREPTGRTSNSAQRRDARK